MFVLCWFSLSSKAEEQVGRHLFKQRGRNADGNFHKTTDPDNEVLRPVCKVATHGQEMPVCVDVCVFGRYSAEKT